MNKITKRGNRYFTGISINGKRITKYFKTKIEAELWLNIIINNQKPSDILGEKWTAIPGFSRYEASNKGRVKSTNYKNSGLHKIITPAKSKNGYIQTMLQDDNGKYYSWNLHKFITLAFYGKRPNGIEVNHIDGDKTNNCIDNLEYCTHSENCKHSFDIGLQKAKVGELNGMAKLTAEQVKNIRHKHKTGGRYWGRNELAEKYNVSAKHIQKIVNRPGKSWMNV